MKFLAPSPFALFLFLLSSISFATEIYMTDIEGLHQKDEQGVYDLILKEALTNVTAPVTLNLGDPEETFKTFETCTDCCYTPANNSPLFYDWEGEVVELAAMNYAKVYIFSPPGKPAFSTFDQLKGKRVGARTGMDYGKDVAESGLPLMTSDSIVENIQKLDAGELDAFIAFVPDAYLAFKSLNVKPYPHSERTPMAIHIDRVICRGAPGEFTDSLNNSMKALRKNGTMRRILGDTYVKPY